MMLDTDGIAGVPINNGRAYSNRFGLAVISDITSYYNTDTRIDVNKLADDVEATRAVVQGTLTEGAIGYRHFEVVKGSKLLATIRLADGSEPPFGAAVLSERPRGRGGQRRRFGLPDRRAAGGKAGRRLGRPTPLPHRDPGRRQAAGPAAAAVRHPVIRNAEK